MRTKRESIILATPVFLSHREVLPLIVTVCHSRCPLYQSVHILDEYLRFCCHLVRNSFRNSYHSILTHIELLNTVLVESLIISFANFHLILPLKYMKSHLTGKLVLSIFFGGMSILLVLCPVVSKLKVEFNYSTIVGKRSKKAFHYQCFPENFTKGFSSVGSSNVMLILINY